MESGLVDVVAVEVGVAEGEDELAREKADDVGDDVGEQCVARYIEREPEEGICAALIDLAGQAAAVDVELEQKVAWREGHVGEVADVPGTDDVAARGRVDAQVLKDGGNLVDGTSVRAGPAPPLLAVRGTDFAVVVGPFVPYRHAGVLEGADVGRAAEEP